MKLEHFALNVADPIKMAEWYVQYLDLKIVKQLNESPFTTFLSDDSGRIMIEFFKKPEAVVPDYLDFSPYILHLAFVSKDPEEDRKRLELAGAVLVKEKILEDETHLITMRDPWGLSFQLCKRGITLLEAEPAIY